MKATHIRAFVPCKDYQVSQAFYQALGFRLEFVSDEMMLAELGQCSLFLQRYYQPEWADNFMLQIMVDDIQDALETITSIRIPQIRYEGIRHERWGKVIYLWGPSGELLHITQLHPID